MGEKGLSKHGLQGLRGIAQKQMQDKGFELAPGGAPGTAFNPETGQNAHWDPEKGQYTDNKTGEALTPPTLEDTTPPK